MCITDSCLSCKEPTFDCIWRNFGCNSLSPSPTHTTITVTVSQIIYSTTTIAIANPLPQSEGHADTNVLALGTVIGLLIIVVLLLIAGWMWTCWNIKKKGIRIDKYV